MEHIQFTFERLEVFQIARDALQIVIEHRELLKGLPGEMRNQLERALVSVVANIAEGAGREGRADQRRHYAIARGSAQEAAAISSIAALYCTLPEDAQLKLRARLLSTVKMLHALMR